MHSYLVLYVAHRRSEELRQATDRPAWSMTDVPTRKRPLR
jgi:hypothetical protein